SLEASTLPSARDTNRLTALSVIALQLKLLGDDWLTRLNESGRRVQQPAARATQHHAADIRRVHRTKRGQGAGRCPSALELSIADLHRVRRQGGARFQ